MFHRVLYIFPIFLGICGYHVSKNLPLLLRTIHWAVFSHLRTNQSAAQQARDPAMQTSGNRKEPSRRDDVSTTRCLLLQHDPLVYAYGSGRISYQISPKLADRRRIDIYFRDWRDTNIFVSWRNDGGFIDN